MPTEATPQIIERMVNYWRGTLLLYLVCMVLLWFEVGQGVTPISSAVTLSSCIFTGLALFYLLIVQCRRLSLRPDQLALGQGLWAIGCIILAYAVAPPARGAVLSLLMAVLVFCAFALTPRASYLMTVLTLLGLGLTMVWLAATDPAHHSVAEEAVHFALASTVLTSVVVLTGQFNGLRERLKAQKTQLQKLAITDELTGLPNRRRMQELMLQRIEGRSNGDSMCLVLLDLDRFKHINDTWGQGAGDQVLRAFAQRLQGLLRETDVAGRWGGEEFLLILPATSETEGMRVMERVREQLTLVEIEQPNISLPLRFSAGLTALMPSEPQEQAMVRASKALVQAKMRGRDGIRLFDPEIELAQRRREAMQAALERALAGSELVLYYQPQVNAAGILTGAEALLRWQQPDAGLLGPASFIQLAEESGLIIELGRHVLRKACRQLAQWGEHPATGALTLSVNVSPLELHHPDFVQHVRQALHDSGAEPRRLKLEITESALLDGADATIDKMQTLRELGVSWSLDDFGTGYSSLAYLKRLPLSQLKIDRSFVADVPQQANAALITRSIIGLGRSLGMDVIAEGVETEAQRDFLLRHGCDAFQGYLYGAPQLAQALTEQALAH